MSTATTPRTSTVPRHPERKWGPFHGGVGVAVWLNEVKTDNGPPRFFRSITIAPRRFREKETGAWKDAASLRATDIPALVLGLEAARAYMATTPLPGEPVEEEDEAEAPPPPQDNGDGIPF
jgi:hypothetical protein